MSNQRRRSLIDLESITPDTATQVRQSSSRKQRLKQYVKGLLPSHIASDIAIELRPDVDTAAVVPTNVDALRETDETEITDSEARQLVAHYDEDYLILITSQETSTDQICLTDQLTADAAHQFGLALHETLHILKTSFGPVEGLIKDTIEAPYQDFIRHLINIAEDGAIEHEAKTGDDFTDRAENRLTLLRHLYATTPDTLDVDKTLSLGDAILRALHDNLIFDTGTTRSLLDPADPRVQFTTRDERLTFIGILPALLTYRNDILAYRSDHTLRLYDDDREASINRAQRTISFWETVLKPLIAPSEASNQPPKQPSSNNTSPENSSSSLDSSSDNTLPDPDPNPDPDHDPDPEETANNGDESSTSECPECGDEFDSDRGRRIHYGQQHGDVDTLDKQLDTDQPPETGSADANSDSPQNNSDPSNTSDDPDIQPDNLSFEPETYENPLQNIQDHPSIADEPDPTDAPNIDTAPDPANTNPTGSPPSDNDPSNNTSSTAETNPPDDTTNSSTESPSTLDEAGSTPPADDTAADPSIEPDPTDLNDDHPDNHSGDGQTLPDSGTPASTTTSSSKADTPPSPSNQSSQASTNPQATFDDFTTPSRTDPESTTEENSKTTSTSPPPTTESDSANTESPPTPGELPSERASEPPEGASEGASEGAPERAPENGQETPGDTQTDTPTDHSSPEEPLSSDPANSEQPTVPAHPDQDLSPSDFDTDRHQAQATANDHTIDEQGLADDLQTLESALGTEQQTTPSEDTGGDGAGPGSVSDLTILPNPADGQPTHNWSAVEKAADTVADTLAKTLRLDQQTSNRYGLSTGTKINPKTAHRLSYNDPRTFTETLPGDEKEYFIVFVLDRSGSMRPRYHHRQSNTPSKIKVATRALASFATACERLDIDVSIIDFYDNEARYVKPPSVDTEFAQDSILDSATGGRTPLADALSLARTVADADSKESLIISITDDKPNNVAAVKSQLKTAYSPICSLTIATDCTPDNPPRKATELETAYAQTQTVYDPATLDARIDDLASLLGAY